MKQDDAKRRAKNFSRLIAEQKRWLDENPPQTRGERYPEYYGEWIEEVIDGKVFRRFKRGKFYSPSAPDRDVIYNEPMRNSSKKLIKEWTGMRNDYVKDYNEVTRKIYRLLKNRLQSDPAVMWDVGLMQGFKVDSSR